MFMNLLKLPTTPNTEEDRPVNVPYAKDGSEKFEVPNNQQDQFSKNAKNPLQSDPSKTDYGLKDDSNDDGVYSKIPLHFHDGVDQPFVELKNVAGFIQELKYSPPTHTPRNFFEQFVNVNNGGTAEVWMYIVSLETWIQIY